MRQRSSVYTDPARLAAEEHALFRGRALMVGMSADLPATGDIATTEVAGVPVLLIRGEDACVRAFLNICRHRDGRVVTARGRPGRAIKCPYHSWADELAGLGPELGDYGVEEFHSSPSASGTSRPTGS